MIRKRCKVCRGLRIKLKYNPQKIEYFDHLCKTKEMSRKGLQAFLLGLDIKYHYQL